MSTHDEIVNLIKKSAQSSKKPKKTTQKQSLTPRHGVIYMAGNGNVVAGGDVHIHHHYLDGARKPQKV